MFVVLFFVFPLISENLELYIVHSKFDNIDGFNLFYVWFKWPMWWLIGTIEIIVLKLITNRNKCLAI